MSKSLATKNVAAVLIGMGLILAFTFSFATTAKADALSDLQAQVNALLAQIAALQGGSGSQQAGGLVCSTFTQSLTLGSTGSEVMALQKLLNSIDGTQVATAGAGSPGNETSYFGGLTRAAVSKFQQKYGITPTAGYWGPISRAKANSLCSGVVVVPPGTPTPTPTPTGPGVTIMAAVQPANSLAPGGTSRVPFTTFTLTNNTGAAVTVTGITVQRAGLAVDAVFSGVVLVDENGLQVGISKTLNSNHQATVGDTFTLNAGQTKTLTVAGNMQSAATLASYAGQVVSLSVVGVNTSVPVNGSLPITGANQTINATLTVGSVTPAISSLDPNSAQTKNIGDAGLKFSAVRFTAGSAEDLKLYSVRWRLNGTVSASDLANITTVVGGTTYATTVSADGRYYTAVFPGGLLIAKGNAVDVLIQGDVMGTNASGRTAQFDIDKTSDVYFVGQLYGYGVGLATVSSGTQGSTGTSLITANTPWFDGSAFTISGASVTTIGKATEVPAQNIPVNVPNQPLGGYVTDFRGEAVSVQSAAFTIATSSGQSGYITGVSIYDENGAVVAGPVDASGVGGTLTFTDTITYPVGRHVYTLKGKLPSTYTNGGTVQISTTPSAWTGVTGQTTGNTVTISTGNFSMNTMTVRAAQLNITVSSQPTSQNIVAGGQGITFANLQLDASASGEDIRISSLKVRLDAQLTSGAATNLTSCQVYDGATALNTGANVITLSTATTTANSFAFDNSLTVAKGTVKTLGLKCNVATGATGQYRFVIDNADAWAATGVTSGNSLTLDTTLVVTDANAGTMTVTSGTLVASTDASSPSYAVAAGGATGVTVGVIKFRASNEAVNLNKLGLTLNTASTSATDLVQVTIWDGATQVGTATFAGAVSTATSTFTTPVSLPKDADKALTIKADLQPIGTSQPGTDGHLVVVNYNSADATGVASGLNIQGSGSTAVAGVRTFKTYPVIALDTLPTNGVADGRLIHFKVTANAAGPVGIALMKFTIATSTITSVTAINAYGYTDASYSQPISGVGTGGLVNDTAQSAHTGTFTITPSSIIQVPAGTTYYFEVRGTVAGVQTGSSVSTTFLGNAAYPSLAALTYMSNSTITGGNFIWSPNATTTAVAADNDWTNGYGLPGLPGSGIVATRSN